MSFTGQCGKDEAGSCSTVEAALESRFDEDETFVIILLPPLGPVSEQEHLESVRNILINGSLASQLALAPAEAPMKGWTWFTVSNSTNVTICCLNVSMSNVSALRIISSSDVMLQSCTFENVHFRQTVVHIINSHPVKMKQNTFTGLADRHAAIPSVDFNTSAIDVTLSCTDQPHCGNSPTQVNCCLQAEKLIDVRSCKFRGLGFVQDYGSLPLDYRPLRGIAIHVTISNSNKWLVQITNSSFVRNSSPVDTTVRVALANTQNSSVHIIGCLFEGNRAKRGGGLAGLYDVNNIHTELIVSGCEFMNNTAYEEGGALVFLFFQQSSETGKLQVSNCHFRNNSAGYIYPLVGGAISVSVHANTRLRGSPPRMPTTNFKNLTFSGNVGSAGAAMFLKGVDAFLMNM